MWLAVEDSQGRGGFAREFDAVEDSQGSLTLWRIRKGVCRCGGFEREFAVVEDSQGRLTFWKIQAGVFEDSRVRVNNNYVSRFWRIRVAMSWGLHSNAPCWHEQTPCQVCVNISEKGRTSWPASTLKPRHAHWYIQSRDTKAQPMK